MAYFVALPDLPGMSLGLGFFPLPPTFVSSCQHDSDCYPYEGPCTYLAERDRQILRTMAGLFCKSVESRTLTAHGDQ